MEQQHKEEEMEVSSIGLYLFDITSGGQSVEDLFFLLYKINPGSLTIHLRQFDTMQIFLTAPVEKSMWKEELVSEAMRSLLNHKRSVWQALRMLRRATKDNLSLHILVKEKKVYVTRN